MGKYAYVKIEYYIVSQTNKFVNRFYGNFSKFSQKHFSNRFGVIKKAKESRYRGVVITL